MFVLLYVRHDSVFSFWHIRPLTVAKQNDRFLTYDPANELVVQIHPTSVLFGKKPECIVFNELVETNDENFICNTTRINYSWLTELAPPRLKKVCFFFGVQ